MNYLQRLYRRFLEYQSRLEDNYQLLRTILDTEAGHFEALDYTAWNAPETEFCYDKVINGQKVSFSAEAIETLKNGDLSICVDIHADNMPTKWGVKPSYHFFKRQDGSVYY